MSVKPLTQRHETVTLYQGDDLQRLTDLAEKIAEVAPPDKDEDSSAPVTMGEASQYQQLVTEHDTLLEQAKERAVVLTLGPVGRTVFREMVEANPPRPNNKEDAQVGVNEDALADVLVPKSIIAPNMGDHERDVFLDSLTHAQYEQLYVTAFRLNRTLGAPPKAMTPFGPSRKDAVTPS